MKTFPNTFLAFSLVCLLSQMRAQQNFCQHSRQSQSPPPYYNSENLRSDTFDILKYTIELEISGTGNPQIAGHTSVRFAPKQNNRAFIFFDLLPFTVDSVKESGAHLLFSHADSLLKVNFATAKNVTDTSVLFIYYHGAIQKIPGQFGGLYENAGQGTSYIYNMGVEMVTDQHGYGRSWFPCFDNFVERSQYEFAITCDSTRRAYCCGQLVSDIVNGNKRTRRWVLNESIPTYLANFSLANYREVNWNVNTVSGNKPILIAAAAADTTAVKNSFVNLKSCIAGFENYYGPYKWNRFGYVITPFGGGAMEHATNITYPRFALGGTTYEFLMAHELSHHWWGNLVTCETPEDMWINEGFASFSADLFYEWQYGKQVYLQRVKTMHEDIVHYTHHYEGGFRAVSGVPRKYTYGSHVYNKGADMAHNLRGYMGDSAFFAGIKYVMQQKSFQQINSNELRDLMATGGGKNLNDFFNDWIFNPGWSHFSIDSVNYTPGSGSSVNAVVHLKQKLYGAPALHTNVPLEISFFKNDWSRILHTVQMSGATQVFTISLPYTPVYAALNFDSKLSDATTHEYRTIKTTGFNNLSLGKLLLTVQNKGQDSSLVRVIHNFVKPDPFKALLPYKISDQHYWKVEGIFSPGFHSKAQFNFNGFKGLGGPYSYLDTLLTQVNCDSIALFYRPHTGQDWQLVKNATKVKINLKSGYITVDTLKAGEYTFANISDTLTVGLKNYRVENREIRVFPNPARQYCEIEMPEEPAGLYSVKLSGIDGRVVLEQKLVEKNSRLQLDSLGRGAYTLSILAGDKTVVHSQKLLLQ